MVARFQSVISAETQVQLLEKENRDYPDHVIACVGGGSIAAGLYYHFLENPRVNIIAVEAAGKGINSGESAATSALGKEGIIHGSKTLLMQTHLTGKLPSLILSLPDWIIREWDPCMHTLFRSKRAEFISIPDQEAMDWGLTLSQMEGHYPCYRNRTCFCRFRCKKILSRGSYSF